MAELTIESGIDFSKLPDDTTPTILSRLQVPGTSPADDVSLSPLLVKDVRRTHTSRRSTVYRGILYMTGHEPIEVVLKTDLYTRRAHDLISEAEVYENKAKRLQGTSVPRFYGLFQGQVDETVMTCLVLEYCGECMNTFFRDTDIEFNMDVLEKVLSLHDAGLVHNDISETNIVSKDGVPFVVDLEHAKAHECGRKMDIVQNTFPPPRHEFGCDEIFLLTSKMGVWTSPYINIFGQTFHKLLVNSPEHLVSMAPKWRLETPEQRAQALEEARKVMQDCGMLARPSSGSE